jgi:DNA polymerase-1
MNRTLLIDADITAFALASAAEEKFNFGGEEVITADLEKTCRDLERTIKRVLKATSSHKAVLFLTEGNNYRKAVLPSYKGNRVDVRKPVILYELRDYMKDNFTCIIEPGIEADDLLGIHATMPHKGERVIYSADKDLKTVPGLHWCPEDGEAITVTPQEADLFFHEQILTGDPTDNYKGCPGVGKMSAKAMLDEPFKWVKNVRVLKSGKNKGQERVEWLKEPVEVHNFIDLWPCIVSAYEKVGLTKADALIQARCARILRHGEYNFETKEVKLWTPC